MLHSILAHLKAESVSLTIIGSIAGFLTFLGLFLHDVTQPKVVALMVFLSDWNMFLTWEWWTRMIIFLAIGTAAWWFQKRKHEKEKTVWASEKASLQSELRQSEILLTGMRTQIAILERRGE